MLSDARDCTKDAQGKVWHWFSDPDDPDSTCYCGAYTFGVFRFVGRPLV